MNPALTIALAQSHQTELRRLAARSRFFDACGFRCSCRHGMPICAADTPRRSLPVARADDVRGIAGLDPSYRSCEASADVGRCRL
jgi:hypothetical protein